MIEYEEQLKVPEDKLDWYGFRQKKSADGVYMNHVLNEITVIK